jgi:hypothetical protein
MVTFKRYTLIQIIKKITTSNTINLLQNEGKQRRSMGSHFFLLECVWLDRNQNLVQLLYLISQGTGPSDSPAALIIYNHF